MKSIFLGVSLLCLTFSVNATLYTYDLVYDGSEFTFDNDNSWNNLAFNVGDSLDITLSANSGDHWKWLQTTSDLFYANIFDIGGASQNGSYTWSMANDGVTVASGGADNLNQCCAHFGPQLSGGIYATIGTIFDEYQFNYTLNSGSNALLFTELSSGANLLQGDSFEFWSWTFNDGTRFQYVDKNDDIVSVPEPSGLAMILIGLIGLRLSRQKARR